MIGENLDFVGRPAKVRPLLLKYLDNSYQLLVVDRVVKGQSAELLREECYRVQFAVIILLAKLGPERKVRRVSLELVLLYRVG